jgi:hypothetical protein
MLVLVAQALSDSDKGLSMIEAATAQEVGQFAVNCSSLDVSGDELESHFSNEFRGNYLNTAIV